MGCKPSLTMYRIVFSIGLVVAGAAASVEAASDSVRESVVILRVTFKNVPKPELGTGFFADHDGLIITADHVITKYRSSPQTPPFDPGDGVPAWEIEVFHPKLPGGKLTVKPETDKTEIVRGRISKKRWIDLAMFRLKLDEVTRSRIKPLDIFMQPLKPNSRVIGYGPTCTDSQDPRCLSVLATPEVTIQNDPRGANEYVVTAHITPGYSGGPLVNESNEVVGVCSRSDASDGPTRAFYVAVSFVSHLKIPNSNLFQADVACKNAAPLPLLTHMDWRQLHRTFPPNTLSESQCVCCCSALKKAPNSAVSDVLKYENCNPPWCEPALLTAQIRAAHLEMSRPEPDLATIKTIYTHVGVTFKNIVSGPSPSNPETREEAYRRFGDFLFAITKDPATSSSPLFSDAGQFALQAYANAQKLKERPETYERMVELWREGSRDDLAFETMEVKTCSESATDCGSGVSTTKAYILREAVLAPTVEKTDIVTRRRRAVKRINIPKPRIP